MAQKVDIRDFRERLEEYLKSDQPFEITEDGITIGVYKPRPKLATKRQMSDADAEAMWAAAERLWAQMAAAGVTEDELVREFEEERRRSRERKAS